MHAHRFRSPTIAGLSLILTLLLGLTAEAQVAITINGNGVDVSPSPILQGGRVFVPLRGVFENLGASVVYDNGAINATGNGREISLRIGSTQANVDNTPQTIDVAPFIVGASTYVPLRFVSQALGASVSWNGADRVVEISMPGAPAPQAYAQDGDWVDAPPPAIPDYTLPPAPAQNDIWVPGYWAWGPAGYYWVPGIWTQAPQPGYLWTPGYWAWKSGSYGWNPGYWASSVGYYGGIDYGAGYYGHGYAGGRWSGNTFDYNTAVTPVNRTVIKNVYVDKTVIVNNTTINRVGFNGGPGGVTARPTTAEAAVGDAPHRPMTLQQQQHVQTAAQDRRGLATVNAGKPPVVVVPKPFTPAAKPAGMIPVTTADKAAAQTFTTRPAVQRPAQPAQRPVAPPAPRPAPTVPAIVHHAPPVPVTAAPARAYTQPVAPVPARPAPPAFTRPMAPGAARPAAAPLVARPAAPRAPAAPRMEHTEPPK